MMTVIDAGEKFYVFGPDAHRYRWRCSFSVSSGIGVDFDLQRTAVITLRTHRGCVSVLGSSSARRHPPRPHLLQTQKWNREMITDEWCLVVLWRTLITALSEWPRMRWNGGRFIAVRPWTMCGHRAGCCEPWSWRRCLVEASHVEVLYVSTTSFCSGHFDLEFEIW